MVSLSEKRELRAIGDAKGRWGSHRRRAGPLKECNMKDNHTVQRILTSNEDESAKEPKIVRVRITPKSSPSLRVQSQVRAGVVLPSMRDDPHGTFDNG